MKQTFSYLALGDSYTIGECVAQADSFPYQLKTLLYSQGLDLDDPFIIAKTGWTTDELLLAVEQAKLTAQYDLVTLLVGVNNQYRNYPIEDYRKEFSSLLARAIAFARGYKHKVIVISIPDWGVTPFGSNSDKNVEDISLEINLFNAVNKEITLAAGIKYIDITAISRKAPMEPGLIATDGLHPSGKMYFEWASLLLTEVTETLK